MASEFSSLFSLALQNGYTHEQLINVVDRAVLNAYQAYDENALANTRVLVDNFTGMVRLYVGEKDVTPKGFAMEGERAARQALIDCLASRPDVSQNNLVPMFIRRSSLSAKPGWGLKLIFWGYNLFLVYLTIILGLGWLSDLQNLRDQPSIELLEYGLVLTLLLIPIVSMVLAVKKRWSENLEELKRFFLLWELPTLVILFGYILSDFSKRPLALVFLLALLCIPWFIFNLGQTRSNKQTWQKILDLGMNTLSLLATGYSLLLYTFYLPLIIFGSAQGLFADLIGDLFFDRTSSIFSENIGALIATSILLGLALVMLLAICVASLIPFAIGYFLINRLKLLIKTDFGNDRRTSHGVVGIVALGFGLILLFGSIGNQSFDKLEQLAQVQQVYDYATRQAAIAPLIDQKEELKRLMQTVEEGGSGYWWSKDDQKLRRGYDDLLKLPENLNEAIQRSFLVIARPFVFQGPKRLNSELMTNYFYVFGEPYYETKESTPNPQVLLADHLVEVKTSDNGLTATVTITETYQNTTNSNQEVIYEFALPSDGVVSGLKLGPNLEYEGIISPRGAAQRTYEAQIQRQRDPALIEQTGPSQYRMRVFPIPGKSDKSTLQGQLQKVQFSYVVSLDAMGFALPQYTLRSNILVNNKTNHAFTLDGNKVEPSDDELFVKPVAEVDRLPDLCNLESFSVASEVGALSLIPHTSNSDLLQKIDCDGTTGKMGLVNQGQIRMAVLADASALNGQTVWQQIHKEFMNEPRLMSENTVDLYFFNDLIGPKQRLDPESLKSIKPVFFGPSQPNSALSTLLDRYDLIVIAVGKYSMSEKDEGSEFFGAVKESQGAVYWYPVGDEATPLSQLASINILRSGGTVSSSLVDAVNQVVIGNLMDKSDQGTLLAVTKYFSLLGPTSMEVADVPGLQANSDLERGNVATSILPLKPVPTPLPAESWPKIVDSKSPLQLLGARGYFNQQLHKLDEDIVEPQKTWKVASHDFAVRNSLVTPYSSLLALVNRAQLQELERQSRMGNAFDESRQVVAPVPNLTSNPMLDIDGGLRMPSSARFGAESVMGGLLGMPNLSATKSVEDGVAWEDRTIGIDGLTGMRMQNSSVGIEMPGGIMRVFIVLNGLLLVLGTGWYMVNLMRKNRVKS